MRKLASVALSCSAAIFFWRYGLNGAILLAAVLALAGVLCSLHPKVPNRLRLRCLLILLGLVLAVLRCAEVSVNQIAPWQARHGEKGVALEALVKEWPEPNELGGSTVRVRFREESTGTTVEGLLYLPEGETVEPGDRVSLTGKLYAGDQLSRKEVRFYTADGVFLRVSTEELICIEPPRVGESWKTLPQRVSRAVSGILEEVFPAEAAGLAKGLVLGDKEGLSEDFVVMSRRAGLAHVIVISGMHISFLSELLTFLLGHRRRWWNALLSIGLLCFFALMAGGTPSAWRAVILCSAHWVADLVGRENDPITSLSAALLLLLLQNPCAAASISLQLSFAAVAGIEWLAPRLIRRWMPKRNPGAPRWKEHLRRLAQVCLSTLAVSLGATAFTAPLCAYYFGTISLVAPVSNVLCLSLVSLAFQGSVLTAVLTVVLPPLGWLLSMLTRIPLTLLLVLVPRLGRLPFAAVTTTSLYYRVAFVVGWVILYQWLARKEREPRRMPVALVCCAGVSLCAFGLYCAEFALSDLSTVVLDVGQGLSVCLESGGTRVLVDCGGSDSVSAGDRAADQLADRGITSLDALVLTHYHADHANGVERLLERMEVKRLFLPDTDAEDPLRMRVLELAQAAGSEVCFVTENTTLPLGRAELTIYAPLGSGGTNERGLAVLAGANGWDVLLTGDMNETVEDRLVKYGALPELEVLVVGHHGSKYSTGEALLVATRPERAVISVGEFNTYGHPSAEAMARLGDSGAAIYRTDLSGTVVIHGRGR